MTMPGTAAPALLAGLIGAGIQASRTPALHEREGAEQGLRLVYRLIDLDALGVGPEALPDLLTAAERMGFAGLNITYPCKQAVHPAAARTLARRARAGRGEHGGAARRPADRPQHGLLRLRRGLPARPARRGARCAWCSSAPAARVRRWRMRCWRKASGCSPITDIDARARRGAGRGPARALRRRPRRGRAPTWPPRSRQARRPGELHAGRHGEAARHAAAGRAAAHPRSGSPRSSISRSRPSCCARRARSAAATLDGGGMAVFQAVGAFRLFTGIDAGCRAHAAPLRGDVGGGARGDARRLAARPARRSAAPPPRSCAAAPPRPPARGRSRPKMAPSACGGSRRGRSRSS